MSDALPIDTVVDIYYSTDGNIWETLVAQCTIDQQHMCTFQTSSLGLFAAGTTEMPVAKETTPEVVTPDFRKNNPTDQEIVAEFFGE